MCSLLFETAAKAEGIGGEGNGLLEPKEIFFSAEYGKSEPAQHTISKKVGLVWKLPQHAQPS